MALDENPEGMDGWRYSVVFAKFILHVLHPGLGKSLSALIPSLAYQFDLDHTTVGIYIMLEAGVVYIACPIMNYMSQKLGSRLVATVGGFLSGISLMSAFFCQSGISLGLSLFFTGFFAASLRQISAEILKLHFGDRYGLAVTVTQIGAQVGSFILPYLTIICLNAYGIRGAILLLSALLFHGVPIGATMRPPRLQDQSERNDDKSNLKNDDDLIGREERVEDFQVDKKTSNDDMDRTAEPFIERRQSSRRETMSTKISYEETKRMQSKWLVIRDFISSTVNASFVKKEPVFMFLLLPCQLLFDVSYGSWAFFSVSYGVSVGITVERAVYLVMMGSVGGIIGRFVIIGILFKFPLATPQIFAVNAGIASVALLAYPINSSLPYLMICSFVSGFGFNNSFSSYYGVVSLKVKKENFGKAMSYSLMQTGVAFLLSGILTGFLYDLFKFYPRIFCILGIFMAIDCVAMSMFIIVESRSKQGKRLCSCT